MEGHRHHKSTVEDVTAAREVDIVGPNPVGKGVGRTIDKLNRFYLVAETNRIRDQAEKLSSTSDDVWGAGE